MKSVLLNDEGADITTATDSQKKMIKNIGTDKTPKHVYPKGTVFEGPQAIFLVKTGQAEPLDDECRKACGLDDAQRAVQQENYLMDLMGINKPEHRDMFRAGIILGFDSELNFIPGPNWDKFQEEKQKLAQEDEIEP